MSCYAKGCYSGFAASCQSDCNYGWGYGYGKSCGKSCGYNKKGCGGCNVTCTDVLKNTVNERGDCCNSNIAQVYAYNTETALVAANSAIPFSHVGESRNFIPPGQTGQTSNSQVKILKAGTYVYDYYVRGVPFSGTAPTTDPVGIILQANGVSVEGSAYFSDESNGDEATLERGVHGFGIFSAPSNTLVSLLNSSGSFAQSVQLTSRPTGDLGSPLVVNASLRLFRLC